MWQAMYLVIPEVTICKYPGFYVTLCIISSIKFENWEQFQKASYIGNLMYIGPTQIHTRHTCT